MMPGGGGGEVVGMASVVVPPHIVDVVVGEAEVDQMLGALRLGNVARREEKRCRWSDADSGDIVCLPSHFG